jgi:hypothetical protein
MIKFIYYWLTPLSVIQQMMHSKSIEDISTITWRCQSQERIKSEMNLCRESVSNHGEENGSMHGFEWKRDGAWEESISSGIEPLLTFPGGESITWNYDGKLKSLLSTFN